MFDRQDLGDGFAATDWTLCPGCFEGYEEAMDGNAEGIAELVESAQRVEGLAETGLPVLRILAPWDGREKARDLAVGLDAVQAFSARMAARTSAYREGESRASDANAAYVAFFEDEVHPRTLGGTFEAARCGALLQGYPDLANLGMWEDFVVRQRRAIDCYLDAAEGYDFAAYERARPGLEARAERLEAATFGIDAQTVPTNRQQAMRFEFALEQAADRLGNGLDEIAAIERRGKERRAAARSRERMFSQLAQDWNRDLATIGRMGSNAFSNGPLTTFDAMERRVQQDRERERLEAQAARAQAQAEAARNANVRSEQRARDRGETVAADEEVYLAVVSGQMPSRCNPFNVVAPGEPEPNCSWAGPVYAVFELGTANSACEGMRDGNAEAWERDAFRILRVSGLTARAEDRLRDLVKESDNQPFAATDGAVTARSEATAVWEGKGSPRERGLRTYYGDLTGMTAAVRATGCAGVTLIDR